MLVAPPVLLLNGTADGAPQGRPGTGAASVAMGTNLSGMEWAKPGLRYGASSLPNVHFTVPRKAEVAYLAACGYAKNRLPIQWELLQPMLHDIQPSEASRKLIGSPGAFHTTYEAYITGVLDAHAAVGMRCIIDNHNYCRYQDFRFQADGSIKGLMPAPQPLMRPYTSDASQVQVRIFSLAKGATLTMAHFTDFWSRAAARWKDHPGFGGYGLMNEPHQMPRPGEVVGSKENPGSGFPSAPTPAGGLGGLAPGGPPFFLSSSAFFLFQASRSSLEILPSPLVSFLSKSFSLNPVTLPLASV